MEVRLPKLKPFLVVKDGESSAPSAAKASAVAAPALLPVSALTTSQSDRKLFAHIGDIERPKTLASFHKAAAREELTQAKAKESLALLHRHLHSWDASRRAILKDVRLHKRKQEEATESIAREVASVSKSLQSLKPPLQMINPARVKATKMLTACQELGREWRFKHLSNGWARWRLFTACSREEEEILDRQATKLQAVYRGYRIRSSLADAEGASASSTDSAARKITRFFRHIGVWRREAQHRDQEEAAKRIQLAFRSNSEGMDFRSSCRRRVSHALAVLGGGSVSKVLRGICWGTYAAVGDGGSGIYKQGWVVTASAMAGFSKFTPQEQSLPPEACEKIGAYLGPDSSLGDCFILARSVFVMEELGTRGTGLYSRLELLKTTKSLEQLVDRVVLARQTRGKVRKAHS